MEWIKIDDLEGLDEQIREEIQANPVSSIVDFEDLTDGQEQMKFEKFVIQIHNGNMLLEFDSRYRKDPLAKYESTNGLCNAI